MQQESQVKQDADFIPVSCTFDCSCNHLNSFMFFSNGNGILLTFNIHFAIHELITAYSKKFKTK